MAVVVVVAMAVGKVIMATVTAVMMMTVLRR